MPSSATLDILGYRVLFLVSGADDALGRLRMRFGHYVSADCDTPDVVVKAVQGESGWSVEMDGDRVELPDTPESPYLEELLRIILAEKCQEKVFVHASIVEEEGSALMFVGASTSGKSTTAMLCVSDGMGLVCDDFAPLELSSARVYPFHTRTHLREHSEDLARRSGVEYEYRDRESEKSGLKISTVFFLNVTDADTHEDAQDDREIRQFGDILAVRDRLLQLCSKRPQSSREKAFRSTELLMRSPSYFDRAPSFSVCSPVDSARLISKHMQRPQRLLRELLPELSRFTALTKSFYLQTGHPKETVKVIRDAHGTN